MKALPLVVFSLTVLAQWVAPLAGVWQQELVLARGTLIRLQCRAPDPYDPLRGRYLAVQPQQTDAAWSSGVPTPRRGQTLYGILATGDDGFSVIDRLSLVRPGAGDYIRIKASRSYSKQVRFEWPFERYYLNEKLAPEADEWLARNLRSAQGVAAEVRVWRGRAVLADLSLDGESFREILKKQAGEQ